MNTLEAYRRLYLIRHTESEIAARYHPWPDRPNDSPMRTPTHLSLGQEGVAVGVAMAFPENRHVWLTHRTHAPYLAFGGSLDAMIAELHGKATGCAGGWGGSMHLYDQSAGVMGGSAIVGSSVSLAVGDAFAAKLEGSDRTVIAWGGDSVPETGQFFEALNFSLLHQLRVLFVIEDNGLSTATPKHLRQPYEHGLLTGFDTDYASLLVVAENDSAAEVARTAQIVSRYLPSVLIVPTTRYMEHVGPGTDDWRTVDRSDDPVPIGRELAVEEHGEDAVLDIEHMVRLDIDVAFDRAEAAPWPKIA